MAAGAGTEPRTERPTPGARHAVAGRIRAARGVGVLAAALALTAAGCGGGPSGSPGASPRSGSTSAGPSAPLVLASGSEGAAASGSSLVPEVVAIDATLLRVLPATVGGLPIVESPEGEAAAEKDANVPKVASAVVSGLAIDSASGDFVFAIVARLLPGAMDDARFRAWRDSYDVGACSQASGVAAHAEATIAGRTVFIGTCGGGVRTYHVWVPGSALLVSASAVGDDRRLGEKLMEGLAP